MLLFFLVVTLQANVPFLYLQKTEIFDFRMLSVGIKVY